MRLGIETQRAIGAAGHPATRLDAGELTEMTEIFSVESERTAWETGTFVLLVVPTRGRATRIAGRFPVPARAE